MTTEAFPRRACRLALMAVAALASATFTPDALARYRPGPDDPRYTPSARYCSEYAEDYVRRHGERGGRLEGAVGGAVRGAVIGRIVDGKDGSRRGAKVGAAVGTIRGGREQRHDNAWLYRRAYDGCMRDEWYY